VPRLAGARDHDEARNPQKEDSPPLPVTPLGQPAQNRAGFANREIDRRIIHHW
jgi:hypothetical protein